MFIKTGCYCRFGETGKRFFAGQSTNWDPEKLVALNKRSGAQYFFATANHHHNLDLEQQVPGVEYVEGRTEEGYFITAASMQKSWITLTMGMDKW